MGNTDVVYEKGNFIVPNRIKKQQHVLEGKDIKMENLFGKIQIPSARAEANQRQDSQEISQLSRILYLDCEHKNKQTDPLTEVHPNKSEHRYGNGNGKVEVPVCYRSEKAGRNRLEDNYRTRKDSPIKSEDNNVEESRVQIFHSRHQEHYFKYQE